MPLRSTDECRSPAALGPFVVALRLLAAAGAPMSDFAVWLEIMAIVIVVLLGSMA
jgi:hypothetical protein